jgi:tetratricopeptide (TPR) repeat protein
MSDDSLLARALRAYAARNHAAALPLFVEALESAGDDAARADILFHIANTHDALGHTLEALEALRDLLALDGDHARAWNNLGVLCSRMGRLEESRAAFEQAYRLDNTNAAALTSLGSVALKQSDVGAAHEYLRLALAIDPAQPQAHANMALVLAVFGRIEEAEESLRLAVLYGFEQAEAVEARIEKMKAHRDRVLADLAARAVADAQPGTVPPDEVVDEDSLP